MLWSLRCLIYTHSIVRIAFETSAVATAASFTSFKFLIQYKYLSFRANRTRIKTNATHPATKVCWSSECCWRWLTVSALAACFLFALSALSPDIVYYFYFSFRLSALHAIVKYWIRINRFVFLFPLLALPIFLGNLHNRIAQPECPEKCTNNQSITTMIPFSCVSNVKPSIFFNLVSFQPKHNTSDSILIFRLSMCDQTISNVLGAAACITGWAYCLI